jgi:hypothetical protein
MSTLGKILFTVLVAGLMSFTVVACGGDSGGDDTAVADTAQPDTAGTDTAQPDTTGTDTAQPDTTGTDTATDGACQPIVPTLKLGTGKQFVGALIDFQTRKGLEGAEVFVLDEETGVETGEVLTSGAGGLVTAEFDASVDKVGFMVRMAGQKDTYQLHLDAETADPANNPDTLWSVSSGTYVAAPALAGIDLDQTKGILAGGLYYVNGSGQEESVGCAKIRVLDGVGDAEDFAAGNIRYMGSTGLPTTLDKQDGINPTTPFFIVANIPESKDECGVDQKVTVTAQMDGTAIGDTYVFSKAGAIFIGNIYTYASVTANPMPAGCGE